MTKYVPPSFDKGRALEGLHKAMGFGEPNRASDKATFVTEVVADTATPVDDEDVPFDPTVKRQVSTSSKKVTCAIEYSDTTIEVGGFGMTQPATIIVTLLDPEYQLVKGFTYVVAGGNRYWYTDTEPPVGLGSLDVWTVHCKSRDEK